MSVQLPRLTTGCKHPALLSAVKPTCWLYGCCHACDLHAARLLPHRRPVRCMAAAAQVTCTLYDASSGPASGPYGRRRLKQAPGEVTFNGEGEAAKQRVRRGGCGHTAGLLASNSEDCVSMHPNLTLQGR